MILILPRDHTLRITAPEDLPSEHMLRLMPISAQAPQTLKSEHITWRSCFNTHNDLGLRHSWRSSNSTGITSDAIWQMILARLEDILMAFKHFLQREDASENKKFKMSLRKGPGEYLFLMLSFVSLSVYRLPKFSDFVLFARAAGSRNLQRLEMIR